MKWNKQPQAWRRTVSLQVRVQVGRKARQLSNIFSPRNQARGDQGSHWNRRQHKTVQGRKRRYWGQAQIPLFRKTKFLNTVSWYSKCTRPLSFQNVLLVPLYSVYSNWRLRICVSKCTRPLTFQSCCLGHNGGQSKNCCKSSVLSFSNAPRSGSSYVFHSQTHMYHSQTSYISVSRSLRSVSS